MKIFTILVNLLLLISSAKAFSIVPQTSSLAGSRVSSSPMENWNSNNLDINNNMNNRLLNTRLHMSDRERSRSTKKGVQTITIDKTETKAEEQKKKEEMWRVVLHNDEVHTFNYVIRSLCKVIGTLDRKAAFEICVQTHGIGKATVTKTWKKQAEQFCLGLQRQGLTVSISPDEDFQGGHSGGGL